MTDTPPSPSIPITDFQRQSFVSVIGRALIVWAADKKNVILDGEDGHSCILCYRHEGQGERIEGTTPETANIRHKETCLHLAAEVVMRGAPRYALPFRPTVAWFAALMEEKLLANDRRKGGWANASLLWLLGKLNEEVGELAERVIMLHHWNTGQLGQGDHHDAQYIEREAADVANVAMMIADLIGKVLPYDSQPPEPDQ
jgi:NTP pyrophosphatase (non-canonical NTP hydrolase)